VVGVYAFGGLVVFWGFVWFVVGWVGG